MSERDPRINPKAGDTVLIGRTCLRCTARGTGRAWQLVFAVEETLTQGDMPCHMDYRTWRNLAKDSTVIYAAD